MWRSFKSLPILARIFIASSILAITFPIWPFVISGALIYTIYKRIKNPLVKYSLILALAFVTIRFGSGWTGAILNVDWHRAPPERHATGLLSPTPTAWIQSTHTPTPTSPSPAVTGYAVVRVIDGDTIDVQMHQRIQRVRLIGINTPETVDPRRPVQCFGVEASEKTKSVLTGTVVTLEADPSQGEYDKYNRLLRYVFLPDGTNFNRMLIAEGFAYEFTYNLPYKYQDTFKEAQREAQLLKKGLWADGACITP